MNFKPEHGCETALQNLRSIGMPVRDKDLSASAAQPFSLPAQLRPHSSQATFHGSQTYSHGYEGALGPASDYVPPPSAQPPAPQLPWQTSEAMNLVDKMSKPISHSKDFGLPSRRPHEQRQLDRTASMSGNFTMDNRCMNLAHPNSQSLLPSPTFGSQSSVIDGLDFRPSSAPTTQSERLQSDTIPISEMLPPPRKLPFPEKAAPRESESAREVPAEPPAKKQAKAKPKASSKKTEHETEKKATKSAKTTAPSSRAKPVPKAQTSKAPLKRSLTDTSDAHFVPSPSAPRAPRIEDPVAIHVGADNVPSSSAPPRISSTLLDLEHAVTKISEGLTPPPSRGNGESTKKRPLSALSDNILNMQQSHTATNEPSATETQARCQQPFPNVSPSEVMDQLECWIRKYHDLPVPKPQRTSKDMLAAFAARSDEAKSEAIDNMICQCLEDPNFVKLVEEVDRHWQRIFLGF